MGYDPGTVVEEVENVSVELQPGLHELEDKVAVTPDGAPVIDKATVCDIPETRFTASGYDTDCPAVTFPFAARDTEKSKGTTGTAVVKVKLPEIAMFPAASRDFTR